LRVTIFSQGKVLKVDTTSGTCFVSDIFYILHNVLDLAIQSRTELVERFGLDVVICAQTADGLAVNAAFFAQLIGCDTFGLQCFPKIVECDHLDAP